MKLFRLGLALLSLAGLSQTIRAQNQTVSGDLAVAGQVDIGGNTLLLGTWPSDSTRFGLSVIYAENATTHAATITFTATRPVSGWLWQEAKPGGAAGSVPQMFLSSGNALTLYDQATPTPNAAIVLNPTGVSTFAGSLTANGTDSRLPNQTLTGNASVLTVGLADSRYAIRAAGTSVAFGLGTTVNVNAASALGYEANASGLDSTAVGAGSAATGQSAIAMGSGTQASGDAATALGYASVASGYYASALGIASTADGSHGVALGTFSHASGSSASALGEGSLASGDYTTTLGSDSAATGWASESLGFHAAADGISSLALGSYSHASGVNSTALANSSVASGDFSVAAGRSEASSLYQFAVGAYGLPGGNAHNWVASDDLFTVGNGQSANAPSNAFTVKKNGNATVAGALTVAGNVVVNGAIRVVPQGDLAMGTFTAEPSPAP